MDDEDEDEDDDDDDEEEEEEAEEDEEEEAEEEEEEEDSKPYSNSGWALGKTSSWMTWLGLLPPGVGKQGGLL